MTERYLEDFTWARPSSQVNKGASGSLFFASRRIKARASGANGIDRLPVFPVVTVKVRVRSSKALQRAVESFNGRFRDEFLNENWFVNLAQAKAVIKRWRQEYNEERPKRALAGLTPVAYAAQLSQKRGNLDPGL